ncbi:hypothetical protein [Pseudomonas rhodesiae]|uniref:hypothetical protein n=1 Tax=Pseudomonas rhodesiae TaxID=76760 RepID=UPI00209CF002|nr:hypothetical protein [Pseudomonas rhodesiae]MCP1510938.1 hypothetical protein [Pseudomonas rhodesiae]MDF9769756.1 hypothetical protein [Pseudomonas rhodesiae]
MLPISNHSRLTDILFIPASPVPVPTAPVHFRSRRSTAAEPPAIPGPAWTLPVSSGEHTDTRAGDADLAARLATALSSGQTSLSIPESSSVAGLLTIYRRLLDQPQTQQWFLNKGLPTETLTLRRHGVEGFTTHEGARTRATFSTTDDSGWWQASRHLRAMRDLLDPADQGLPHLASGELRVPLHVVLQAYGLNPAENAQALTARVLKDGLMLSPHVPAAVLAVKQLVSDLDERAYLATLLEQQVQGLSQNSRCDWSTLAIQVSPASAQGIGEHPRHNVAQLLQLKGLGTPGTVAQTRHAIQWLRTALPPAPALGDYAALIPGAPGELAGQPLTTLATHTPETLRHNTELHLDNLAKSPDAMAFGAQLAAALQGPAGTVAGYALYQPANAGRTLNEVRSDLEAYLRDIKHLDPKVAVLVAHVGLARSAPEFLVREVPDAIRIGTPAWMELRLGCAMAEAVAPGTSRAMDEQQVSALTTLTPLSDEQRTLMQGRGLSVLLDWAVLNGVIPERPQGEHSEQEIKKASELFGRQRRHAARSFRIASTPLPTRRALAVRELLKVFPGTSTSQLEAMTVFIADAGERRNMRLSEPRTRSLIEAYMTGDLVPGKWILTRDIPPQEMRKPSTTPFQFQNEATLPVAARERLDSLIRRLPVMDDMLKKDIDTYHNFQQRGFVTKLKLMFAGLPLADRQRLELGEVDLFTLRKKTGKPQVNEEREDRAAVTGHQGALMRVLHDAAVTYYEVLYSGSIVKHDDPQVTLALDRVILDQSHIAQYKLQAQNYIRRGHEVPLDFNAYASGAAPDPQTTSADIIIDRLGRRLPAAVLPDDVTPPTFVPDSYQSERVEFIACEIAEHNFYETADDMLTRAKGQLSLEKNRQAHARDVNLLVSLVPFVGAYQEFSDGNFAKGMQSLALDVAGVAIGAGGQARALIRSARVLAKNTARPTLGRLGARVAPMTPKVAWSWTEPKVRFSDAAFDFSKQSTAFFNAVFNPLDGYPRLLTAASRGLAKLPTALATTSTALGKAMPHLIAVEQKMCCYLLVATGAVPSQVPGPNAAE